MVVLRRLVTASDGLVPVEAQGATFVSAQATGFGEAVPEVRGLTSLDGVPLTTETDQAGGE